MATSTVTFPVQVIKSIVFEATNQDDLDYLNNKEQDEDFIADIKEVSDVAQLRLVSVDGEVIK